MDALLDRLVTSVTTARSLEELTRPLLEMLQAVSGLDSAYLTVIDAALDQQRILFSHNTQTMVIPEGLAVPWGDTLCKRALDENRPFTSNVSSCWGDSEAAKALGIETYLSVPVRLVGCCRFR
jgi:diguanylate cyclase